MDAVQISTLTIVSFVFTILISGFSYYIKLLKIRNKKEYEKELKQIEFQLSVSSNFEKLSNKIDKVEIKKDEEIKRIEKEVEIKISDLNKYIEQIDRKGTRP